MEAVDRTRESSQTAGPLPRLDGCRMLLVDDEPNLLEVGEQLLSLQGIRTLTASSGEEALEILRSTRPLPDCIILDLNMPGMGGAGCLREIIRAWPDLPVIVSTGYLETEKRSRLLAMGAFDCVEKPYRFETVLDMARRALWVKQGSR